MYLFRSTVIDQFSTYTPIVRVKNKFAKHSIKIMRIFVFAFVFCATIAGSFSRAQTTSGTILGIVTDNSGAVIPDANVTVTNVDTQVKNSALSDGLGSYQFVNLPPGNYTVDVQKTGFVHLKRGPVALEVQGSVKAQCIVASWRPDPDRERGHKRSAC